MRLTKLSPNREQKLSNLFSNFMAVKEAQGIGDKTNYDYQMQISKFIETSHDSTDYDLLNEDVLSFFAKIPDTSPARFNKPYQYINAFLVWLLEEGYIAKNPLKANHIKKKKDEGNIKPVSEEDFKKFVKAIDKNIYTGRRNYCIANVMYDTGIRTSELLALKNSDYNPTDRSITVSKKTSKTKTSRILYLLPATCTMINEFMTLKPDEWEDWLFPSYEGKQYSINKLDKAFCDYSELSGVKIKPYQLRHTYPTEYLKNGGNVLVLQKMMGHTNLNMTKRYTEIDPEYLQSQHDQFSPAGHLTTTKIKKIKK